MWQILENMKTEVIFTRTNDIKSMNQSTNFKEMKDMDRRNERENIPESFKDIDLARILKSCSTLHFKIIRYFHPSGKSMPNGIGLQRGGFLKECRDNAAKFMSDDDSCATHNIDKKGGIIVFPSDMNIDLFDGSSLNNTVSEVFSIFKDSRDKGNILEKIVKIVRKKDTDEEPSATYSIGKSFKGKFVTEKGIEFNEHSITVYINNMSSSALLLFAELLSESLKSEAVLVKDLNNKNIYLK